MNFTVLEDTMQWWNWSILYDHETDTWTVKLDGVRGVKACLAIKCFEFILIQEIGRCNHMALSECFKY